jgi:accessory gene regulator protein AgrB
MLTDLDSNCFGNANIGPLCFLSILSWILLSWVEMLLKNNIMTLKKGVWVLLRYVLYGSGNPSQASQGAS